MRDSAWDPLLILIVLAEALIAAFVVFTVFME